jgi:hypothetical protein
VLLVSLCSFGKNTTVSAHSICPFFEGRELNVALGKSLHLRQEHYGISTLDRSLLRGERELNVALDKSLHLLQEHYGISTLDRSLLRGERELNVTVDKSLHLRQEHYGISTLDRSPLLGERVRARGQHRSSYKNSVPAIPTATANHLPAQTTSA